MGDLPKWRVVWADTGVPVTLDALDEYVNEHQQAHHAAGSDAFAHWTLGLSHRQDGFAITDEGLLLVIDRCGCYAYPPEGLFRVEVVPNG